MKPCNTTFLDTSKRYFILIILSIHTESFNHSQNVIFLSVILVLTRIVLTQQICDCNRRNDGSDKLNLKIVHGRCHQTYRLFKEVFTNQSKNILISVGSISVIIIGSTDFGF